MEKIKLKKEEIVEKLQFGALKIVKFKNKDGEITFETSDGKKLTAIYYEEKTERDRFITLDNFEKESIQLVKNIFK